MLKINQLRSNDENFINFRITVTQGAQIITSSDLLIESLKGSIPHQKGIIDVSRISNTIWEIKTNKSHVL